VSGGSTPPNCIAFIRPCEGPNGTAQNSNVNRPEFVAVVIANSLPSFLSKLAEAQRVHYALACMRIESDQWQMRLRTITRLPHRLMWR
jgi:hypothetical protein